MKNTKKVTIPLMALVFLILASCQQQKKQQETEPAPAETQEMVKPPEGIISLEESKSLYDNYTENRAGIIQDYEVQRGEGFEAARFSSFDYATIQQYMAYIEQEAKSAEVDISSLRLYFANYPDKEDFPNGKKIVHPRQNSIFIVPTMKVDGQDYGFYIGADGKAKLIKDAVGAKGMGSTTEKQKAYASFAPNFSPAALQGGGSLNLNRGQSGPPPNPDF
ncbi:hypothetical protein [Flagellimonas myxillae]|uniref:hypothetical protein n=1 Tax=Flagellimonas myxillae TaxID=2942214 RepID=UPI00201F2202|nr:hypothetical protein [Muricauda myxillae]MCL6265139.1 hypothetical protein [Muricauda myxillae]